MCYTPVSIIFNSLLYANIKHIHFDVDMVSQEKIVLFGGKAKRQKMDHETIAACGIIYYVLIQIPLVMLFLKLLKRKL